MTRAILPGDLVTARGREWVALPAPRDGILALRPLTGSEADGILIDPRLELAPVAPARFDLPPDAAPSTQGMAVLLADALRFTLRRGAGPFSSVELVKPTPEALELLARVPAFDLPVEAQDYELQYYVEVTDASQRRLATVGDASAPRAVKVTVPAAKEPPPTVAAASSDKPWYARPWVWAVAGGVVAGGAATAFLLSSNPTATVPIRIQVQP